MIKRIILILTLITSVAYGQGFLPMGNNLERKIVGVDTTFRIKLGSPGIWNITDYYTAKLALKADKATTLTINGVSYNLSENRTWTIEGTDTTSLSDRIDSKLSKSSNLSDLTSSSTARTNLGLGNVDNTSDADKPVSTATQAALDLKANIASPTFTGTVTIPTPFTLGATSVLPTGTELNYVDGVTAPIQDQLDSKAPSTGGTGYIQNTTSPQSSSNYNISGAGVIGTSLTVGTDINTTTGGIIYKNGFKYLHTSGGGGGGAVNENQFWGYKAGSAFSGTGYANTLAGNNSGTLLNGTAPNASSNVAYGYGTLISATTASFNAIFGTAAGANITTEQRNSYLGYHAGSSATGNNNTGVGAHSLENNTADANNAFGYYSLSANTTGVRNSAFGYNALSANTSGNDNTAFGYQSFISNINTGSLGFENTGLGSKAGQNNTTGYTNTYVGSQAFIVTTTGHGNVGVGRAAGFSNITGNDNVYVGLNAANTGLGSNNIVIGRSINVSSTNADNELNIGGVIFGVNTYGVGRIGIGAASPTARFHLPAGTAAASTAPLKFTPGTNLTTIEAGAVEYNGTNLFYTNSSARKTIANLEDAQTFAGNITASSFVKSGGTTAQFLKADGSVDANTYLTSLAGDVTSIGNATSIAAGVIVNADINASAAIDGSKIVAANTSTTGALTSTDWNTFNGKANSSTTLAGYGITDGLTVASVPVQLFDNYTTTGNINTLETDLTTYTLPAGRLANNGEKLTLQYAGNSVNESGAFLEVYFGGVELAQITTNVDWDLKISIIRTSSSTIRVSSIANGYSKTVEISGLTLNSSNIIKVTGTGTNTDDITFKLGTGEWKPAAQ